jgi:hypothetical protein
MDTSFSALRNGIGSTMIDKKSAAGQEVNARTRVFDPHCTTALLGCASVDMQRKTQAALSKALYWYIDCCSVLKKERAA